MHVMRFMIVFLGIGYGLCRSLPALGQPVWQPQLLQPPEVRAEIVGDALIPADVDPITFRIAVHIPPDHHGYLDKGDEGLLIPFSFTFPELEKRGAQVTLLSHPAGERDDNVHATVLRGRGDFVFRLHAKQVTLPSERAFSGVMRYQICNDITNICYPPRQSPIPLRFASLAADKELPAGTLQQTEQLPVGPLTISERVTSLFQQYRRHFFLALSLVFLAGLIASATPCVYPILPITSALLVARGGGSRQRGQLHAVVYFLGLIFFYTLLGLFAAVTGSALSKIMTNGWVNLGFAVIFAYFGLSMLGLYEFQFLSPLIAKLDASSSYRAGFSGTFLMGTTAGLVASPCVGPVAGAILLQITGQTAGAGTSGDVGTFSVILLGTILMSGFGAGLGLPFLAIGLASHWLPQSGRWLTSVKFALGLPILYFAYTYYLKAMETIGVPDHATHAMLVGVLAIGIAVFIGAFHPLGEKPQRGLLLRRALGIVLLIVGIHFLYNGLGQSGVLIRASRASNGSLASSVVTPLRPLTARQEALSQVEIHGNLRWLRDFPLAQQHARTERKPLFVDFYATWCANCKAFQKLAETHNDLNRALRQAVLVKIYDTDAIFRTFQQDQHYPELNGIGGQPFLPLFAIYSSHGTLTWKGQNYKAVRTMIAQLQRANNLATP